MSDCLPQTLVDLSSDFCCVTVDPYWLSKLYMLRKLAGMEAYSAQEIINLAKCDIAQWGKLRGIEMFLLCNAYS